MCRQISREHYLSCQHTVHCHLKYEIQRCHAPNGIRFRNPDPKHEPNRAPSWACPEKQWLTATIRVIGYCPVCAEKSKKMRKFTEQDEWVPTMHWEAAGEMKMFACGHQRVFMWPRQLQGCFSPIPYSRRPGGPYRVYPVDIDGEAVFSWTQWEALSLDWETSTSLCPECRRQICRSDPRVHGRPGTRKPRGLYVCVY
ncbi:hypothetical protein FQN49_005646 [Arthroderma sp. PD_2]|nr:hypothetical protein FQN49_005646 [Arthroderma sp. PD_2]